MVDLRTHVLPGFDDGAPDMETAVEMCRLAAESGTRELVATPLVDLHFPFDRAEIDDTVRRLQAQVGRGIYLHSGCELRLGWDSVESAFEDLSRFALNGGNYILIEFSRELLLRDVGKIFEWFREAAYVPILVDVERNSDLRFDTHRLGRWVDRGCLLQVTAGSLLGVHGERAESAAVRLLDAGLAHFVASDGRSVGVRAPKLIDAYEFVVYRWGEQRARKLFIDNPWAALWGEPIDIPRRRTRRSRRRGWAALLSRSRWSSG